MSVVRCGNYFLFLSRQIIDRHIIESVFALSEVENVEVFKVVGQRTALISCYIYGPYSIIVIRSHIYSSVGYRIVYNYRVFPQPST